MLVARVARQSETIATESTRIPEPGEQLDRVPDRLAVDRDRRRRDGHADERVKAIVAGRPIAWPRIWSRCDRAYLVKSGY